MPGDPGRLSCAEYNFILIEFYLKFLHPAPSEAGLAMELTSDWDYLALKGFECLRKATFGRDISVLSARVTDRWKDNYATSL